jgi:predicted CXXCH cytochrome family protein
LPNRRKSSARGSGSRKKSAGAPRGTPAQDAQGHGAGAGLLSRTKIWIAALGAAAVILSAGVAFELLHNGWRNPFAARAPTNSVSAASFVGSETCAGCHQAQAQLWRGSQHKLAMQHATDKSVLGNFNDAGFDYYGVHSRFFRKDGKFLAETDGPDGKLATFEIKYTFGIDPLQQYLIEFPDGRLQALSIAWDSRRQEHGGQRWFHLYPNEEIRHDDVLHWTKLNQNWNFMCAECHSTGVRKNYDAAADRFATTWAEISVGCETCHGRGSRHVGWARDQNRRWPFGRANDPAKGLAVRFDERADIVWRRDPTTGNPQRNFTPATLRREVETCGLCHARRGEFSEDWVPGRWLSDTHVVSPLARGLYHADGQMRDEVYNYGSFKQSKMFAAGVTCSDCHEPHAAKLRAPGDGVCLQCHSPDKYAAVTHHHHAGASAPLACASCHMPASTYMVVDRRHDHGFRVPRPDLSARLGTPNACNDCHADKSAQWAASAIESWHGPKREGFQIYAEAFHAAWTDRADAAGLLAAAAADPDMPAFARAGALTELASHDAPANINLARSALSDPDPMVRIGALDMLESFPAAQIWPIAAPLLSNSNRGVRIRAASLLAAVPTASQPPADREQFDRAAAEFVAAQHLNADRPEARSMLGRFYARRGLTAEAEMEYRAALRLSPQYAPAAGNLADIYRGLGREADGESVLRAALVASPQDAGLHHALGLTLVRLKRNDEALAELRRAAELAPDLARYAYVYAVALHSAGRVGDAMTVLKESLARHPDDRDALLALISFNRDAGNLTAALEYGERLARIAPNDVSLAALIDTLRRQTNKPDAP